MSFFDDASLAFLPSGGAGKNGKAYSMKPTDGSGDFTFSRGGDLTATRADSNGLIEKGRENLTTNSIWNGTSTDTEPTGWVKFLSGTGTFDVTATQGQIRFQTLDASSRAYISSPTITTNGIVVASVYVDEVTTAIPLNQLLKRGANATDLFAYEDGVEINYSDNVQAGKRYSVVFNKTGSTTFRFGVGASSGILGDLVLSRPQIEVGLVATEWITSPIGSTGLAGLLEHSPRFDYSGGASCPSLLLEPSRTNLIKHSEYIGSLYSEIGTDVTDNATQSPSGTNDAALIYEDLVNSSHWVQTDVTTSSSTTYTQSAFVKKKDSGIYASLRTNGVGGNSYIIFDFDTATIVDEGSDIISSGVVDYSNGWYRIHMTYTLATISFIAGITNSTTNPIPSYLGTGKGYYLWGLQLEEGSYPTSYIPNHSGTTGTISTRNADSSTLSGIINGDAAFTFMIESGIQDYGSSVPKYFDAGALGYINHNTSNTLRYRFGGSNYVQSISGLDSFKFLLRYDSSEIKVYFNGSLEHTISASLSGSIGLSLLGGLNKQILLFPTALSDADCITLTS